MNGKEYQNNRDKYLIKHKEKIQKKYNLRKIKLFNEGWDSLETFPNYLINKKGEFYSIRTQKKLNTFSDKDGYLLIKLFDKTKKPKICKVHRLLGERYILNPKNKTQINHIKGVKGDNSLENLEWVTPKENVNHSIKVLKNTGWLGKFGKDHARSKKIGQYDKNQKLVKIWHGFLEIERDLGFKSPAIWMCCNNKPHFKTSKGYIWKYINE